MFLSFAILTFIGFLQVERVMSTQVSDLEKGDHEEARSGNLTAWGMDLSGAGKVQCDRASKTDGQHSTLIVASQTGCRWEHRAQANLSAIDYT